MEKVELSKEELELIESLRREKEDDFTKATRKHKEEIESKILQGEEFVKNRIADGEMQVKKAEEFYFDSDKTKFQLNIVKQNQSHVVKVYSLNKDGGFNYDNQEIILDKKYQVRNAIIVFKEDTSYKVDINKEHVGSGRNTRYEWRMSYNYKNYKRVSTVEDKILDKFIQNNKEKLEKKLIQDLLTNTDFRTLYPGCEVEGETIWAGGYRGNRYEKYMNSVSGKRIILSNGVKILLKPVKVYNEDKAEFIIQSVKWPTPEVPDGGDALEVVGLLSNMKFNF